MQPALNPLIVTVTWHIRLKFNCIVPKLTLSKTYRDFIIVPFFQKLVDNLTQNSIREKERMELFQV